MTRPPGYRRIWANRLLSGFTSLAIAGLAAIAAPSAGAAVTVHRDELIPLYDNALASEWQTACSQSFGGNGG